MTTAPSSQTTRWQEIIKIWQQEPWLYGLISGLTGFICGVAAAGVLGRVVIWFANGFWNEALSIAITVLILDRLNRSRVTQERKLALFRQLKSRSQDFALDALEQIQHEGWWQNALKHYQDDEGRVDLRSVQWGGGINLEGVNLQAAKLEEANLQAAHLLKANLQAAHLLRANLQAANLKEANLQQAFLRFTNLQAAKLGAADLQQADLHYANLQQADLVKANLKQAKLGEANLQHANLVVANLQQASLVKTDLQHAFLELANLQHAILRNANLQYADLSFANLIEADLIQANLRDAENIENALFDEKTLLPDGKILQDVYGKIIRDENGNVLYDKYWTPDTDMTRYTDPDHPDFWEPTWAKEQRED